MFPGPSRFGGDENRGGSDGGGDGVGGTVSGGDVPEFVAATFQAGRLRRA